MKREKMAYRLKKELDAARYAHTLGVEKTAREMAEKFGVDEEKAALAGLHTARVTAQGFRFRSVLAMCWSVPCVKLPCYACGVT